MRIEIDYIGETVEATTMEYSFDRDTRINGKPSTQVFFGGLTITLPSNAAGLRFMEEPLRIDQRFKDPTKPDPVESDVFKRVVMRIYDSEDYKIREIELLDAHVKISKETFIAFEDIKGGKETSMQMKIHFMSASQCINGSALNVFAWRYTDPKQPEYQSPVVAKSEPQQETDLKFIAKFERLGTYKGEFGFDWMRDNYKDICEDYEKLKKEYFPTSIYEEEYFVPSVSMFPNQEGVKLKLAIKRKEGTISDDDVIKLPAKSGIRFEPNEVKVSEVKDKQITVICESPLNADVVINLLDKNDKTVGKLNIVKNDVIHDLNVKIVKVVRKESKERDLGGINDALIQVDLKNYLNKNSLQQALIKTTINDDTILELDGEKLKEEEKLVGATFKEKVEKISSMFLQEYIEDYEKASKHKGLLLFVTILQKPGSAGDGQLWIGNARNCTIFNFGLYQPSTYAHELAHVLGCTHSFGIKEEMKETIKEVKEAIAKNKEKVLENRNGIPKYEEKIAKEEKGIIEMKKYPNNATAIKNIETHKSNIEINKGNIKTLEGNIKILNDRIIIDEKKLAEYNLITTSNQHIFPIKNSTKENFMDYTIPRSARISFWKWQWKAMQEDIKRYYTYE